MDIFLYKPVKTFLAEKERGADGLTVGAFHYLIINSVTRLLFYC